MRLPSPAQVRAARAMLNWSKIDLAKAASVSVSTVLNLEGRDPERVSGGSAGAIRVALETAGVWFIQDDSEATGVMLCPR
ncbi:XRE family transcriptional regulator [Lichenibacterium minor]|uniref:XRE family transcriptional regulator n=2 Tax=Lichenibacterium minor TaxID=2316528 RepID=A0A4Q2UA25_9HYPH|nr:XRE family transcriptional regulator [Lichenibacterium minor]